MQQEIDYLLSSLRTVGFWKTILMMIIGSLMISLAVNGLLIPNKFFDGGVNGLSLMVFYVFGMPSLGVIYFLFNIPIFLTGWRAMSLKFIFVSLIGVFIFSTALNLLVGIQIAVKDPIMVAILAGIIKGFGTGIYLRVGGSFGGLDIVATVLKKKFSIPMGNTFIFINATTLFGAYLIYDLNIALYTGIFMFVDGTVIEKVQTGFSQRKAVFIVSEQPDLIAEQVMKRLDRGVTFFKSTGGWSHQEKKVIYTVINMIELGRLKEMLFEIDPDAFVAISNTSEVIGKRFLSWEDEGFTPLGKKKRSPRSKSETDLP
ncbi:YitT family protein [bacterium]|nr:YitT family protein [bacterium]